MKTIAGKLVLLTALLPIWAAAGCGYNVEVKLDARDDQGTMPSVAVHLVAVKNKDEYQRLHDIPMTEYWDAPQVDGNTFVMKMGEGKDNPQVLSKKNPIWDEQWKDAKLLFVMTNYPGGRDMPGNADARRIILPLKKGSWNRAYFGEVNIPLVITAKGVACQRSYESWDPFE